MAIDVRQLRPSMLTRMLNSTPLGEVLGDRQLRRHRNRAGYRIGDEKHVDLLRYAAWLLWNRHNPEPEREPRDYEAMKEAARARNAELSAIGRDIRDPRCRSGAQASRPTSVFLRSLLPRDLQPAVVARPPEGDRQDRDRRAARRTVCDGDAARQRQDHAGGDGLHLGDADRPSSSSA